MNQTGVVSTGFILVAERKRWRPVIGIVPGDARTPVVTVTSQANTASWLTARAWSISVAVEATQVKIGTSV